MASSYGLNFGFRRSEEHMRSGTEGRLKVPATGVYKQGDLVTFDPANPGYLMAAAANTGIDPGFTGLLIQEDGWNLPLNSNQILNTYDEDIIYNSSLAAIWTGAGLKVWMKNTAATAVAGQRARAAVTKVTVAGLVIGDLIAWDGTKYVETATLAAAVGRVTLTNGSNYIEAVLLK